MNKRIKNKYKFIIYENVFLIYYIIELNILFLLSIKNKMVLKDTILRIFKYKSKFYLFEIFINVPKYLFIILIVLSFLTLSFNQKLKFNVQI